VIGADREVGAFQEVSKVAHGLVYGEQFAIESTVLVSAGRSFLLKKPSGTTQPETDTGQK
jgi:hypothetical protein